LQCGSPRFLLNATVAHNEVRDIAVKLAGDLVEVLTALGEDHRRTALAE